MENNVTKLKRCPFCGEPARRYIDNSGDRPSNRVGCIQLCEYGMDEETWQSRPIEDALTAELTQARDVLNNIEGWADDEHNVWSSWMRYMFSKGTHNPDGTWTMPKWAVERWMRQMETKYEDLSEQEKKSDRDVFLEWHGHMITKICGDGIK